VLLKPLNLFDFQNIRNTFTLTEMSVSMMEPAQSPPMLTRFWQWLMKDQLNRIRRSSAKQFEKSMHQRCELDIMRKAVSC
jgi:hypothetical protein